MIQPERVEFCNSRPIRDGRYVLYWMQAAQRAEYNHALEYAAGKANELRKPLVVLFCLVDDYPEANERHYCFMLQGLAGVQQVLAERGIQMIIRREQPAGAVAAMATDACLVVVDAGHTRIQRKWRAAVGRKLPCAFYEVETNLVVPVTVAASAENFSAGTFRPRIMRKLNDYLIPIRHARIRRDSIGLKFDGFALGDPDKAARALKVGRSVRPVADSAGGTSHAKRRLRQFIRDKLDRFAEHRNDPNADCVSGLSPYLHFGQISPLYVALEVSKTASPGKGALLEELIVRRELSFNFVHYNHRYDRFDCLPPWACNTLNSHSRDKREYVYSRAQFEAARTHDPYWNAAQKEMVLTGTMHGYMRMYWGKKILEWSRSPKEGFRIALFLNNKYELDGRGPNAYAGVAWCFGKHDRAWSERPVFGKVRYMNAAGLKRKFDADAYVMRIDRISREQGQEG